MERLGKAERTRQRNMAKKSGKVTPVAEAPIKTPKKVEAVAKVAEAPKAKPAKRKAPKKVE